VRPVLGIGGSCNFTVRFQPGSAAGFSDSINLKYHNGIVLKNLALGVSGSGVAAPSPAVLNISNAPSFNYGAVFVGTPVNHVFSVSNSGGQKATAVAASIGAPYAIVGNTCGAMINAGTSCNITVRFLPTAVGVANGNLHIAYDNGPVNTATNRAVTGTGKPAVTPANFTLTGAPIFHFGARAVGSTTSQIFVLKNIGGGAGNISSVQVNPPFAVQSNSCGVSVASGVSCNIKIGFSPVAAGLSSSPFKVNYFNGTVNTAVAITVDGTGIGASALSFAGGSFFNFGPVLLGQSAVRTFALHNSGSGPALGVTPAGTM
jgi:hypothetical protein